MKTSFSLSLVCTIFTLLISNYCHSQCPVTLPGAIDSCSISTGTVQLGATGSSGYYNWYDAAVGGNHIESGPTYVTPVLASTTTYYVAAADTNFSLNFDGVDDQLALGNPLPLQITGDLTIEMWVKPANFSQRRNPYAKAYGGEGTITQELNGTLNFYYGTNGGNGAPYQGFNSVQALSLNTWHHIAIVRDLTGGMLYWYIDGVLTNSTAATYGVAAAGALPAIIGDGYTNSYAGNIDEVRVWSSARSLVQLQNNSNICLTGAEANLQGYWGMNDGPGVAAMATDATANGINGTLTNMTPLTDWEDDAPGISCVACESGRTPVTATIGAGVSVNLGIDTCVNTSIILDAGAGYVSYLWSDLSTGQTLNVSADGVYHVTVSDGACSDRDTIDIDIVPVAPGGIDSCRLGAGSIQLGGTGSTGFYNWYDASSGGNFLGSGSTFNTPIIATTTTYYVSAIDTNFSLNFDGTDDHLTLGNPIDLQITGDLTLEMWVKPANFSQRRNPYAKAYGGEGTITQELNGTLNFYYGTNGGNGAPYQGFNSVQALSLNTWHHIALVRDLTGGMLYWYIDGVQTNSAAASFGAATAGSLPAIIGDGYTNSYAGNMDNIRVWNTARSQADIQAYMDSCMDKTSSGLVAYWDFNDGTNSGTTSDISSNSNTATLTNMDATTDWDTDSPSNSCTLCESNRTAVVATIDAGTPPDLGQDTSLVCVTGPILLNPGAYTTYLWQDLSTAPTFSATTNGTYWVEVTNGSCAARDTIQIKATGGSALTLDFDGTNDHIDLGNPSHLQVTGDLTIEMWVRPTSFAQRRNPYAKAYGGEGTITQETNGTLNFYYGTNGGNGAPYQGFNSVQALTLNTWHHIALVRDLSNSTLHWYIDGVETNTAAATYGSAAAGANTAYIGQGYVNNYQGQIDEFRLWNDARTQTELRDFMCKKLLGSEANMIAYYRIDDGAGTIALDESNFGNNGTITNMTAGDWIDSGAPIGDESIWVYPGSWAAQSLNLAHCSGEDLTVSNIAGTPSGLHIYYVDAVPNYTAGISGLGDNDRYFGVHKVNDPAASYDATYNYLGNPYVWSANEPTLELYTRTDNAVTLWGAAGAALNVGAKTLFATAQSTEFILGSTGLPLPIELLSFEARANDQDVQLLWSTASEVNNDYFTLTRSANGIEFYEIGEVEGAGNSSQTINYTFVDTNPLNGVNYYQLQQTDFDGSTSFSNVEVVKFEGQEEIDIIVYPNPTNGREFNVAISNSNNTPILISVMDASGRLVHQKTYTVKDDKIQIDFEDQLSNGMYMIQVKVGQRSISKQFVAQ